LAITSNRHYRSHVIVWFLMVAGLILTITGYSIYRSAEVYLVDKLQHQQLLLAISAAALIDGHQHQSFKNKRSMRSKRYQQYEAALKKTINADEQSSFIYTLNFNKNFTQLRYGIIPKIQKENSTKDLITYSSGDKLKTTQKFNQLVDDFLASKLEYQTVIFTDKSTAQQFISLAIISDTKNKPSGILIVESSNHYLLTLKSNLLGSMLITIGFLFIALLITAIFFARKITSPFEQLTDAIARLIKNDFNFNLSLTDFGGFTDLAKQFNLMLLKLQVSRNELVSTNKAYSRFVPHQILKLISPNGIKNVGLGDCIEKEMTVLFCDIRNFTSLSESMLASDSFEFINRYLKIVVPVINKHGGTIDKYMGDGIMALFPNSADNALNAAVGMMASLKDYNKKLLSNKLPALEIGLGLHTGNMILGTVGTSSRMDVTAISDTVNAAARVESLTKTFKAPILISEELRIKLDQFDKSNLRFIATCLVQGKSRPMTIYEVFSHDNISVRNEKLDNQNGMIKAWEYYKDGDSDKSISEYQKLMDKSPMDKSLLALIEVVQRGRL